MSTPSTESSERSIERAIEWRSQAMGFSHWIGLGIVAAVDFHIISTLVFAVMGLAPSSAKWSLLLTLAGVLALAGTAVGIQSYLNNPRDHIITGTISGIASGGLLGFFMVGQLGDQQASWAVVGLIFGSLLVGSLAVWAYRRKGGTTAQMGFRERVRQWVGAAIALTSGLCAYALAFGLFAWVWMAIDTGRVGLAAALSLPAVLYLWFARRAILMTTLNRKALLPLSSQ